MKKWNVLLLLFFLLGNTSLAQTEKQVSLEVTNFFHRFINPNPTSTSSSSTTLNFLLKKGEEDKFWRYGTTIRLDLRNNNQSDRTDQLDVAALGFRVGREYYQNLFKKWKAYIGWESSASGSIARSVSNDVLLSSSQTVGLGIHSLTGVEFRLNSKLSFFTEAKYGLVSSFNFRKNQNNDTYLKSNANTLKTNYQAPITLYISYKFNS